ncbi:uncharacterized membrane protein YbaN (DUF454 family) [Acetoanaerobium pronyense]|uniref:Uncharacterized membrane protein YbaN (DUF454 family) n=1 Tax=Acetoanaerobium pronyense TaxID=1482736 RepID=A0ABS4KQN9_9FIRM|nr:YbaN family protein [Acetoanaerobium pronyense]MBP2028909.1 uncharacterized membrane protein YbaN (DUF454 family) [Acetoanaerobium pronyense]
MIKILLLALGTITLILGTIGILLPVLPTTPFLLISLFCYMKSSDKLYNFVLENKYLGPYVHGYVSGRGIPMKAKIKAISLIIVTVGSSIIFFINPVHLKIMLFFIATTVCVYIWTRKTATEA